MASPLFQRAVLYLKEIQDMSLFAIMSDSEFFLLFGNSPAFFVMLPLIGIFTTLIALINAYELAKANNKNLDKWFGFIISGACAVLASISLYGAVISTLLEVAFPAGPWLFLASIVFAAMHQALMLGLNLYRTYESLPGSGQRKHFIQAALKNSFILGLISAIAGAVVFVMLTPIAPAVGSAFAMTALVLTGVNMLWRMIPYNWKQAIKGALHLGKPEPIENAQLDEPENYNPYVFQAPLINNHRIFSQCDHSAEIKIRDLNTGINYLQNVIDKKIANFNTKPIPHSEINIQKEELLSILRLTLDNPSPLSKQKLLDYYPLAFQSFWADKGEVEHIFDAVVVLKGKYLPQKTSAVTAEALQEPISFTY